jgi:hypothetical protein
MEETTLQAPAAAAQGQLNNLHPRPLGYFLLAGLVGAGVLREMGRLRTQARGKRW